MASFEKDVLINAEIGFLELQCDQTALGHTSVASLYNLRGIRKRSRTIPDREKDAAATC